MKELVNNGQDTVGFSSDRSSVSMKLQFIINKNTLQLTESLVGDIKFPWMLMDYIDVVFQDKVDNI